jgi:paired amphipathic helix protein Sin3a
LVLYEKDRFEEKTTAREQIVYRIQVEGILAPEDHLFRFEWVRPLKPSSMLTTQDDDLRRLGIQLLNKEDLTLNQATTREEKWAYYVDSYYMHANTEGINTEFLHPPMARRSIKPNEVLSDPAVIISDLQVKICLNTYKLFYLCDTEDAFIRSAADRAVKPTRWNYNRAARKADGKKWTWEGYSTKMAEDEKAALEAARAQNVVPHPSSIGVASAIQMGEGAPTGETAPPAEQPPTEATPAPSVPVAEDGPAPGEVKTETPPLASEPGEAMDIEEPSVAPALEPPRDEKPATEDVEMADA